MAPRSTASLPAASPATKAMQPHSRRQHRPMVHTRRMALSSRLERTASPHPLLQSVRVGTAAAMGGTGSRIPMAASRAVGTGVMVGVAARRKRPRSSRHRQPQTCGKSSGMGRAGHTTTTRSRASASGRSRLRWPEHVCTSSSQPASQQLLRMGTALRLWVRPPRRAVLGVCHVWLLCLDAAAACGVRACVRVWT